MAWEFIRNGVLYQVQTHVGDGGAVVEVLEKLASEQKPAASEVQS